MSLKEREGSVVITVYSSSPLQTSEAGVLGCSRGWRASLYCRRCPCGRACRWLVHQLERRFGALGLGIDGLGLVQTL